MTRLVWSCVYLLYVLIGLIISGGLIIWALYSQDIGGVALSVIFALVYLYGLSRITIQHPEINHEMPIAPPVQTAATPGDWGLRVIWPDTPEGETVAWRVLSEYLDERCIDLTRDVRWKVYGDAEYIQELARALKGAGVDAVIVPSDSTAALGHDY
jgi:hypothetical protein